MASLEKKFDQLLIFAAISTRPDEALADRIQRGDPAAIGQYYLACQVRIDYTLQLVLKKCAGKLAEPSEEWRELAKKPKDFDKALDKLLRGARTAMKLLHRIPDHRPSANEERDRTLSQLKSEHPEWSFGQLANQYNHLHPDDQINANRAERCYKQEAGRLRLKLLQAFKARKVHLRAKSLWKEELRSGLLTEYIFDILTDTD